ncbi:GNAT superfamily N-acetyltransferase [Paraburkholderia sp. MM5477-R1]
MCSSNHPAYFDPAVIIGGFMSHIFFTVPLALTVKRLKGKGLWLYVENGRTLASVVIDGDNDTGVAHLRWFIVDDSLRGSGIGRQLLSHAMRFVDERFDETYLWTFKGLDAARHLYESFGFRLSEESEGTQWGTRVVEQRFNRLSARKGDNGTA